MKKIMTEFDSMVDEAAQAGRVAIDRAKIDTLARTLFWLLDGLVLFALYLAFSHSLLRAAIIVAGAYVACKVLRGAFGLVLLATAYTKADF